MNENNWKQDAISTGNPEKNGMPPQPAVTGNPFDGQDAESPYMAGEQMPAEPNEMPAGQTAKPAESTPEPGAATNDPAAESPDAPTVPGDVPPLQGSVSAGQTYNGYAPYTAGYSPIRIDPVLTHEKNQLRKIAAAIGTGFLALLILSYFWNPVSFLIGGAFGLSRQETYAILTEPAVSQVTQVLYSIVLFTVPFTVVFKCFGYRNSDLVPLCKSKKGTALPLLLLGIGFAAFANLSSSFADAIFNQFMPNYTVNFGEYPKGFFGFMLALISTAIVPALVEEFACRGLVLGLLRKYGDAFAVVTSALLFGLVHGNFIQMPFAAMLGLVLGYSVVATGSLRVAMLVHCINNLVSVLLDYMPAGLSQIQQNTIYYIYIMFVLIAGVAALAVFVSKHDAPLLKKPKTVCTEKQKYKWFFTSVLIIIYIGTCLVEAFSYF